MELLEVGFVLVFLAGVALCSVPAALVLAGVLGVLACERRSVARARAVRQDAQAPPRPLRRVA